MMASEVLPKVLDRVDRVLSLPVLEQQPGEVAERVYQCPGVLQRSRLRDALELGHRLAMDGERFGELLPVGEGGSQMVEGDGEILSPVA